MNKRPMISGSRFACVIGTFAALQLTSLNLGAQTTDADAAFQQAMELFKAGQTVEAIAANEKILKDYPTSTVVAGTEFQLGYLYFQNGDLEKSVEQLKKILQPPATPEIQQLGYSLLPQVMAAIASKLPLEDPNRKASFEAAIKNYDLYIQKFPTGDEMETIVYGRSLCFYQIGKYDEAATGLRSNLAKFQKSESILDSQYLLAIALATQASVAQQADPTNPQGLVKYDEPVKLLNDIIQRHTDIALANDAQFEIGEILMSRAAFSDKAAQPAAYAKAVAAYRAVAGKEPMIKAQEDRIEGILRLLRDPANTKNVAAVKLYQRLIGQERGKLATLKTKADQTVSARIKIAQSYYNQNKYDETRQLLTDLQPFIEDQTQKKSALYYITLSYIAQNIADKAVSSYAEFKENYKNDPMAENLPLAMGAIFLTDNPKINDPTKAIDYFKEEIASYPQSRFVIEAISQQAYALVQLKRFDEALDAFHKLLAAHPSKEIASAAQFGIGSANIQINKPDEALAAFKEVREKYQGTPQVEQADYYIGQIYVQKEDFKTGLSELTQFVAKYPESPMLPTALFYLANAQKGVGDKDAAIATYKDLAAKFPQAEAAQYSYFQRAAIASADQKQEELIAVMKEFLSKYPESDKAYFATDSIGQNQMATGQAQEAIVTYSDFVEKHPKAEQVADALFKITGLNRGSAEAQGRYLVLNEDQRTVWLTGVNGSLAAGEKLIQQFPENPQVALTLQNLLADQRLLLTAKLKTDAEVQQYFQDLATKLQNNPPARSKVLFTLASYTYEQDKAKALEQMKAAYDPKLLYAPTDLDLYASALIEQNDVASAKALYDKIASDYPIPAGVTPDKAPPEIAEAQAIALYGIGRCAQTQGNIKAAGEAFDQLKTNYPWSPKILEANFGIAQALYQQKKYDDAVALLIPIMRAQSASATADIRANAMLLGGEIQEEKGNLEAAIDYYIKIASFYEGVPMVAAEGLWKGGQLLEKQSATLPETGKVTKSGQMGRALKAYKDLTEKYPTSPFVEKAKQRLVALTPVKK